MFSGFSFASLTCLVNRKMLEIRWEAVIKNSTKLQSLLLRFLNFIAVAVHFLVDGIERLIDFVFRLNCGSICVDCEQVFVQLSS